MTFLRKGTTTGRLVGNYFMALLMGRSDLFAGDYRLSWAEQRWAAGGRSRDTSSGANCSFRHYRDQRAEAGVGDADDLFFYSTEARKTERVGWDLEFPLRVCAYARGWYKARGGRTERYRWKVADVRDVLAPINAKAPAYPNDEKRNFGPLGASLASDRWELRRVLVLEASLGGERSIRRYVDLETLFTLYHVEGRSADPLIFQYAGRWSGDRDEYPQWPEDISPSVRVIDSVVRVSIGGGEVVRTEAWNTVSLPPEGRSLRRMVSEASLSQRR